jgi:hypothetical protein
MKYGKADDGNKQIIIKDMAGIPVHFLVAESFNDTYGDLKDVLRPHLDEKPARHQLVLVDKDDVVIDNDKTKIMSENMDEPLTLQLLVKEAEWGDAQKDLIRHTSGEHGGVSMYTITTLYSEDAPENREKAMNREAFIWSMEHSPDIKSLTIYDARNIQPIIPYIQNISELHLNDVCEYTIMGLTDVLWYNETIKSLIIENPSFRVDWLMYNFFKSIGYNNGLINFTMIQKEHRKYSLEYEMDHLCMMLSDMMMYQNTSLRTVEIKGCTVKIEKDLTKLVGLLNKTNLRTLRLSENRISTDGKTTASEIISSLQPIRKDITELTVLDRVFVKSSDHDSGGYYQSPMIEMVWVNPNVDTNAL